MPPYRVEAETLGMPAAGGGDRRGAAQFGAQGHGGA